MIYRKFSIHTILSDALGFETHHRHRFVLLVACHPCTVAYLTQRSTRIQQYPVPLYKNVSNSIRDDKKNSKLACASLTHFYGYRLFVNKKIKIRWYK